MSREKNDMMENRGRREINKGIKLNYTLGIRVSSAQLAYLKELAGKEDKSVTSYVRGVLLNCR